MVNVVSRRGCRRRGWSRERGLICTIQAAMKRGRQINLPTLSSVFLSLASVGARLAVGNVRDGVIVHVLGESLFFIVRPSKERAFKLILVACETSQDHTVAIHYFSKKRLSSFTGWRTTTAQRVSPYDDGAVPIMNPAATRGSPPTLCLAPTLVGKHFCRSLEARPMVGVWSASLALISI